MDFNYETIEAVVSSKEFMVGALAFAGAALYGLGRNNASYRLARLEQETQLGVAQLEHDTQVSVAKEETEKVRLGYETSTEESRAEIKRLEYENASAVQQRELELERTEHEYRVKEIGLKEKSKEDRDANRIVAKEKRRAENTGMEIIRYDRRIEVAGKLVELRPVFESYIASLTEYESEVGSDEGNRKNRKKRKKYRRGLMGEVTAALRADSDGFEVGRGLAEGRDVLSAEVMGNIENMVDAKYQSPGKPQLPIELKTLLDMLNEGK